MIVDIFNTDKKYDIIYADPPWQQMKSGTRKARPNQGRTLDYHTLSLDTIQSHLKQADALTGDKAVLFLWTIDKYLFEAQKIAEELGYKLHARMIWNKVTGIPAAFTIRYGHEYLLYMYKGGAIAGRNARAGENTFRLYGKGQKAFAEARSSV